MPVIHGLAQRAVAGYDGLADEGLGTLRGGLAGHERGQPLAAHRLRARPGLVVGDHAAALLALLLARRLGLLLALALVALGAAARAGTATAQAGGVEVGDDPHRPVLLVGLGGLVLLVGAVLGVLVPLVLGVDPLLDDLDASAGNVGPLLLGQRLAVLGDQPLDAQHLVGLRDLLGGQHRQPLGAQPLDLGGVGLALGGLVAQPLGLVSERATPPLGVLQALDGLGVVLELGEDRGLLQRQVTGVEPIAALVGLGDHQGGVHGRAVEAGALGDLRGAHAEQGQLLHARDNLGLAHPGPMDVLDHLVTDPVGVGGLGYDAGRDQPGRGADLGGGHRTPLATQQDVLPVLVAVDRDGLQHAALLDRLAELLVVGSQVGSDVGADDDVGGVEVQELLSPDGFGGLVGVGRGGGLDGVGHAAVLHE